MLAQTVALAIETARVRDMERLASTDSLTGLYNRRYLQKRLKEELQRSCRYKLSFSVVYMDLDRFKEVNDRYGHEQGDKVLQKTAEAISEIVRKTDTVARYGGDEFVLILPETKLAGAETLTERIRGTFNQCSLPKLKQQSISAGVAEWSADGPDTPDSIMQRADACLYEAKKRGRNCVVTCPESIMSAS